MARKNKNLATSFNNVARNDSNNDVSYINNINNNINKNNFVQSVIGDNDSHEDKYVMRGIYIEKDLAKVIDQLAKKGGRGTKSRIVNEALRKVFTESGLL
ncbi:ribbon-helix-helix domain-containing protein [Aeribacillus alveayuensis]|uniref:Ribbon-helix-helix protein CopG domain-containing protein n=1 Tax=Aeribacillus alveayuensis TaxID=279215 RepID=A0ABT9VST9_9BACI|nr:hypothetical protein [Bacillus alveayuensis]